ncbi:unnamed protein product [Durusdinium trenchii]|uniref:Uncharacterized protein n=1 Tax=Durusdinium trenchii TaxID=1381693 RepID=A0ABP0Q872_9DINO
MPVAPTANEEGAKALVEAVSSQEAKTVKTKKPKKETPVENAEPKSVQQLARERMEECLKKSADARKYKMYLWGSWNIPGTCLSKCSNAVSSLKPATERCKRPYVRKMSATLILRSTFAPLT